MGHYVTTALVDAEMLFDVLLALGPPANARGFDDSVVVFVASVLVGGIAIHVAANHLVDAGEYGDAVLTALLGALAWALLDSVWLVGPAVALVAWVAVIKWRYPTGWLRAGLVGGGAWAIATVVVAALALLGVGTLDALGVPGA